MAEKSVDRAEMAKARDQIDLKHQQIHSLRGTLRGQMGDLQARWTGNASTAFQQGYRAFDEEFEKVQQGLEKIHTQLAQTQTEYVAREEENQATANQIAGLIG